MNRKDIEKLMNSENTTPLENCYVQIIKGLRLDSRIQTCPFCLGIMRETAKDDKGCTSEYTCEDCKAIWERIP